MITETRSSKYDRTPHLCFKLQSSQVEVSELSRVLESRLSSRFGSVRAVKIWFSAFWAVALQAEEKSFAVALDRNKYAEDEWVLLAAPLDTPALLDRLRKRKPLADPPELRLICNEIHAAITATPGVSAVRWYFEGFNSQGAAVLTPNELSWI